MLKPAQFYFYDRTDIQSDLHSPFSPNMPDRIQHHIKSCLWSLSPLSIPKAWWTLWALECRNQTDRWSCCSAVRFSPRGGQHRCSQADCWGSRSGWGEWGAGCVGGEQTHVPAASPGPPEHPERGGAEEDEGRRPFSSSHALYLRQEEERGCSGASCIWKPLNLHIIGVFQV